MRIPLSHKQASDAITWLHTKKGEYPVRSGYNAARTLKKSEEGAETSTGPFGVQLWSKLWKLRMPNKIKVFGWRACLNTLPTRANLVRRKIIEEDVCLLCSRESETRVHALWDCAVAKDVWAGSWARLQKSHIGQQDVLQLFLKMFNRLTIPEFELFISLVNMEPKKCSCSREKGCGPEVAEQEGMRLLE